MGKELENREVEDGLEKRAGEDGVSEEPEELEEEGFGFCVDIWGHRDRSKPS